MPENPPNPVTVQPTVLLQGSGAPARPGNRFPPAGRVQPIPCVLVGAAKGKPSDLTLDQVDELIDALTEARDRAQQMAQDYAAP